MSSFISVPYDHGIVYGIILYGIGALMLAMVIRMIASWVRIDDRYPIMRFFYKLTDPFITPFRRLVPPVGVIDVSFFIGFFFLFILQTLLTQALPPGW
jgi:YggT family protein